MNPFKVKPRREGKQVRYGDLRFSPSAEFGVNKAEPPGTGQIVLPQCGAMLAAGEPDGDEAPHAEPDGDEGQPLVRAFRMLSATLIRGHWIDYSDPGIWTPEAVGLFNNTTVYMDHDRPVADWIGVATGARLTTQAGVLGVDADFTIDPTQDMLLAKGAIRRGMTFKPVPAIRACSVGISFEAKPSHLFRDPWDFWMSLGDEVDGEIVRFIVTKILRIVEVSLVYAGADPGALALAHGVDDPAYPEKVRSFLAAHFNPPEPSAVPVRGEEPMNPELKKALQALLGVDPEGDPQAALSKVQEVGAQAALAAKLESQVKDRDQRIAELENAERSALIEKGLANGALTQIHTEDTFDADGKTVLAKSWAASVPLAALRAKVNGGKASPGPANAKANLQPPAQPGPSMRGLSTNHEAVAQISRAFGKKPEEVIAAHANYMNNKIGGEV